MPAPWGSTCEPPRAGAQERRPGEIASSAGSLTVPVRLTHSLHPKAVVLPQGLGHWALGKLPRPRSIKAMTSTPMSSGGNKRETESTPTRSFRPSSTRLPGRGLE